MGEVADKFEAVAAATVEARIFLDRVKPRKLMTTKSPPGTPPRADGRVISTDEIAKGLVKRADLAHAVLPGKGRTILCADCKRPVKLKRQGRHGWPKRCPKCCLRECAKRYRRRKKAERAPILAARRAALSAQKIETARKRSEQGKAQRAAARAAKRPSIIICSDCRRKVNVAIGGRVPSKCWDCRKRDANRTFQERMKRKRQKRQPDPARQAEIRAIRSEAGRKGAASRWHKTGGSTGGSGS